VLVIFNKRAKLCSGPDKNAPVKLSIERCSIFKEDLKNLNCYMVQNVVQCWPSWTLYHNKKQTLNWTLINNVQFEFNQYFIFREKSSYSFSHMFLC
jgi:hypothetical protein